MERRIRYDLFQAHATAYTACPANRRSRSQRWRDAVAELLELQLAYQAWLDALPENLADSGTGNALCVICELDLSELESAEPPLGFGGD